MEVHLLAINVLCAEIMVNIALWSKQLMHSSTKMVKKSIHLFQNLNCSNFGIYAAQCTICNQLYRTLARPKTNFLLDGRHTGFFCNNKFLEYNNTDQAALLTHYHNYHYSTHVNKPKISDCFYVIFLEEPQNTNTLNVCESRWIRKLKAKINMNQTILPIYR